MSTQRKNQADLSTAEWNALIDAINKIHVSTASPPKYSAFYKVHEKAMDMNNATGLSWGVHTMRMDNGMLMSDGRNFLSWHRRFVLQMEKRLQKVNKNVSIPYWDWMQDRQIPGPLSDPALIKKWKITRGVFDVSQLPSGGTMKTVNKQTDFIKFQRALEGAHAGAHNAVGGTMGQANSPKDPIFFLHHANIDRIWAEWQTRNQQAAPPNLNETLKPLPIFGVTVASVQSIATLGYEYL